MWLVSILAVSLVCALADTMMPNGPVKRVGRLVCGLVLVAAILSPLAELDVGAGERWLEDYFAGLDRRETELREQVDDGMKTIIEQEYAAYIVDKAAQLGLSCSARVECRAEEEGLYLPVRIEVTGPVGPEGQAELARVLETELGVPPEGQTYHWEEETP